MFKLIVATVAALYFVLLLLGDESRRPAEVTRAEPLGLEIVGATAVFADDQQTEYVSAVSEAEAVQLALEAGKVHRANHKKTPIQVRVAKASPEVPEPAPAEIVDTKFWYVTGTRVNLRGGPSTSDEIVAQLTRGTEAEVLSDADGWFQIRVADSSVSGWIFGKFLEQNQPG